VITDFTEAEMNKLKSFKGWEEFYEELPLPTRISEGHYWDSSIIELLLKEDIVSEFTFHDELREIMTDFNTFFDALNEREKNGETNLSDEEQAFLARHRERMENFYQNTPNDYGVCDSPEQVLAKWPQLATDPRRFVVLFGEIRKEDQPEQGGWRWHKWGEYIGTKEPQYEYLADEEDIDSVLIFQIVQLKK
jgi:hypothetical protein